jgi:hypothetical protein
LRITAAQPAINLAKMGYSRCGIYFLHPNRGGFARKTSRLLRCCGCTGRPCATRFCRSRRKVVNPTSSISRSACVGQTVTQAGYPLTCSWHRSHFCASCGAFSPAATISIAPNGQATAQFLQPIHHACLN